jgi:hypothetical protein
MPAQAGIPFCFIFSRCMAVNMPDHSSPLLEELAAIKAYLGAARDIVKDGFMPDLAAIEKGIADLCIGIQAADVEEQSRCLPQLAGLLKSLDECEHDIRAWARNQKAADAS